MESQEIDEKDIVVLEDKTDEQLWALLRERHKRINDAADREAPAVKSGVKGPIRDGALQTLKDRAIAVTDALIDEFEKRFFRQRGIG
jgi:hypothetical protein